MSSWKEELKKKNSHAKVILYEGGNVDNCEGAAYSTPFLVDLLIDFFVTGLYAYSDTGYNDIL